MKYLVDTHIFLWWIDNPKRLKDSVRNILEDSKNQILSSVINGVEISIKQKKGKLRLKTTLQEMFEASGFDVLEVNLKHVFGLSKLPLYHSDPFDRILTAQAKVEGLTLITADEKIWKYKVSVMKA